MSNKIYGAIALTGGADGALDAEDGTNLVDGDIAFVVMPGSGVLSYILDDDSGAAESSPGVISPDANAGTKRWILQPGTMAGLTINGAKNWSCSATVADDGSVVLPAIAANSSAHGTIQVSAAGVIEQSAEFEIDSTGNAAIIRSSAGVVVNADTDAKLCIGTAAGQNPMTIKNRLGGAKIVVITLWYS